MKKGTLIIIATFLVISLFAQKNFYVGYENGGLFDRHHYVNEKGYSSSQFSIGGVLGGYVGYRLQTYTFETGFYSYNSYTPQVNYNFSTGEPSKSNSMSDSEQNFVIPLRVGKEFLFAQQKFYVKPEISFNIIISRDYSQQQPNGGWGTGEFGLVGDTVIPFSPYYTYAKAYDPTPVNLGIGTDLSIGYRIKQRMDIYIKAGYLAHFSPIYHETIVHQSPEEVVTATSISQNAMLLQIGLKFFIKKIEI